jgi:hypothetical protein
VILRSLSTQADGRAALPPPFEEAKAERKRQKGLSSPLDVVFFTFFLIFSFVIHYVVFVTPMDPK